MNYKKDTKKGLYKLTAPEKYVSDKPPAYKSGWELHVFVFMERNPFILKWGYEPIAIYYTHPFYQKMTVYYPDIWCHIKKSDGKEYKMLVEIKPKKFRGIPQRPIDPKRPTILTPDNVQRYNKACLRYQKGLKRYEDDMKTFAINTSKWQAAQAWCARNGVLWKIMDEDTVRQFFSGNI